MKQPARVPAARAQQGFTLVEVLVDYPGQEQKSQWLQIRRDKPATC